jgi:hypothetical protein
MVCIFVSTQFPSFKLPDATQELTMQPQMTGRYIEKDLEGRSRGQIWGTSQALTWNDCWMIIIGRTAILNHNLPQQIPPDLYIVRLLEYPVLTSLNFATIFCFIELGRQPCVQPPNLEGQVSVFMSPSERVTKLHPQALGSLFVAFCDSQGYGGGILTRLHTGHDWWISPLPPKNLRISSVRSEIRTDYLLSISQMELTWSGSPLTLSVSHFRSTWSFLTSEWHMANLTVVTLQ